MQAMGEDCQGLREEEDDCAKSSGRRVAQEAAGAQGVPAREGEASGHERAEAGADDETEGGKPGEIEQHKLGLVEEGSLRADRPVKQGD